LQHIDFQIYSYVKIIDLDIKYFHLFIMFKIFYDVNDVVDIVVRQLFVFTVKPYIRHLCEKIRFIYHNQTSLQHLLQNELN